LEELNLPQNKSGQIEVHDNEVEIEDVDIEGAIGSQDAFEGSSYAVVEEEIQGSGGQNGSDPTAVAKVYEGPVPTFVAGGTGEEGSTAEEKAAAVPKPNRIKVACWDFRATPVLNETNAGNENGTMEQESLTSEEETLPVSELDENLGDVEGMNYLNRSVEVRF